MKKIALLIFIICCLGGSLFSVDWGFKFGMGFTDVKIKETTDPQFEDFEFNSTELFGVFVSFKITEALSICPEINYLLQGGKIRRDIMIEDQGGQSSQLRDKLNWKLYTINFPLIFKLKLTPHKSFSPTLLAGPYATVVVDSSWISESMLGLYYDTYLENEKPQGFDYGVVFGLGLDVKLDRFNVLLELRYRLGLKNLAQADNEVILNFSNRGFFINFGIHFGKMAD